jgi:hypothetical protein
MHKINGLGFGPYESGTTSTTAAKPAITDALAKWFGVAQKGAEAYSSIKNSVTGGSGSSTGYNAPQGPPPPPPKEDNTGKYVTYGILGLAGAATLYGVVQLASKKK